MTLTNPHRPHPSGEPQDRRRIPPVRPVVHPAPISPVPAADPRRQAAMRAARRHSGRVRLFKIVLPIGGALIALALVGIVYMANVGPGIDIASYTVDGEGIAMNNPRLSGHDGKNRSYEVQAKRAVQSITNPNVITLEKVSARIDLATRDWATFAATVGRFDRKREKLVLDRGIVIQSGSGYRATLSTATIDLKSGTMSSDKHVSITSPSGSIDADSVRIADQGRHLTFTGNVRMRILPSQLGTKNKK